MAFRLTSEGAAYAVVNEAPGELVASSSGGAFSLLAKFVFLKGGVVYGCAFDDELIAHHVRIEDSNGMSALRGSKYVQSDMGNALVMAKDDLESGLPVLFSGTPCQVDGLKSFLQRDYENLLCVDIVCHGVPSQKFLKDYLDAAYGRDSNHITKVVFRDKRQGWTTSGGISFDNQASRSFRYFDPAISSYYGQFKEGEIYRESCYCCPYATTRRCGDFTLGDFWGLDERGIGAQADNGVSLVLINTEKARMIAPQVFKHAICEERPLDEAKAGNSQLNAPVERPASRDVIMHTWLEDGMHAVISEYRRRNLRRVPKWVIKRVLHILMGGA